MEHATPKTANPRAPQELRDRIEESWQAWVATVDGIPDDRLVEPVVGHWSIKDLLGHVAFWEDWGVADCRRILAGLPAPVEDTDPVNQGQVMERQHASPAEQRAYRDEAHARLAAFLGTIADDEPAFPDIVSALSGETWEHYDEHAAEVRDWRTAQGL